MNPASCILETGGPLPVSSELPEKSYWSVEHLIFFVEGVAPISYCFELFQIVSNRFVLLRVFSYGLEFLRMVLNCLLIRCGNHDKPFSCRVARIYFLIVHPITWPSPPVFFSHPKVWPGHSVFFFTTWSMAKPPCFYFLNLKTISNWAAWSYFQDLHPDTWQGHPSLIFL